MNKNPCDLPITSESEAAVDLYRQAQADFIAYGTNLMPLIKQALEADPGMVMANCLRGYLPLLLMDGRMIPSARKAYATANASVGSATPREQAHVEALGAWLDGGIDSPIAIWENVLLEHPTDILALRMAHFCHLQTGDIFAMRDSVARVRHGWDDTMADYGIVLGMHSFGLEECGDFPAAEAMGREAVDRNPADIWAVHCVAHVLEMQGRHADGIDWVRSTRSGWEDCNFFTGHIFWHEALYLVEQEKFDGALNLYDSRILDAKSERYVDMCNEIALLWRLSLRGVDIGDRWDHLADKSELRIGDQGRSFIDSHFLLALIASGRMDKARALVAAARDFDGGSQAQRELTRRVGVPLLEGLLAFGEGNYRLAVERIMSVRYRYIGIGGSHAQRDLYTQILIEAAFRGGAYDLARALLSERTAAKPLCPRAWSAYAEALDEGGDTDRAVAAREAAERLLAAA
jgi:tetratricopeptide (TPR) repeat protein